MKSRDGGGVHGSWRAGRSALAVIITACCSASFLVSPLVTTSTAAAPVAPFGDGAPYPGPLPLALAAAGGPIQAENFNSGPAQQAFHGCTPGDSGNGKSYRSDAHDIDIVRAGAGQLYIESSRGYSSADPAHTCPTSSPFFSDYVKYSFTVAQTGWYKLSAAAQHGEFWTRVDDVNVGQSPRVGSWAEVVLAPAVHLTAGPTHVLSVELLGFKTDLDAVYVTPVAMSLPAPRVVAAPLTKDEVVVADAVVTDPQFGAVPNNAGFDNHAAIQKALDLVRAKGGGTVFVPPGVYTVKSTISVPPNVTLRGDWSAATATPNQTILAARVLAGVGINSRPFISLAGANASVSHLSVWYPNQSFTHPLRYPPTIRSLAASVTVNDVTLYNSDQGILYRAGSAADITGLRATCFTVCLLDDGNLEYAFITNIKVSNQIWASAPATVTGKPATKANRVALRKWTTHHLTGVRLYRNDNITVYDVSVADSLHGIVTTAIACKPRCGTYGSFSKIAATLDRRGDDKAARPVPGVNSIMDTDLVSQAKGISYRNAPSRFAARTDASDFYDVRAAPYSAQGDAFTDDAAAIQRALDAAGARGGGTVYLSAGTYLVSTHLVVPPGVELRGAFTARHTSESVDATTLLAVEGQGTASPNSDAAFISLSPYAGVRGITVRYPNQGFGSATYPVVAFPYSIRSLGVATWVRDVNVLNGYQIIDLASYRSDGFAVKNLWATAFLTGVNIAGGSSTGWLERSVISYGDLYESRHRNSPHAYGRQAIVKYTADHVVAYYLGSIDGLQSLGAMSFNVAHHLVTYKASASTPGPTNATMFASSSDSAGSAGFIFQAGSKLSFVGLLARSPYNHTHLSTATSFGGVAFINDAALDGRRTIVRKGGTLHVFPENLKR